MAKWEKRKDKKEHYDKGKSLAHQAGCFPISFSFRQVDEKKWFLKIEICKGRNPVGDLALEPLTKIIYIKG